MTFTHDWFSHNIPTWEAHLKPLAGKPLKALEVGCFEGRATRWLLENVLVHPDSRITVCDTFEGAMEHRDGTFQIDFSEVERVFDQEVTAPFKGKVTKIKDTSFNALVALNHAHAASYGLVYIDGSHVAKDVMTDALLAWALLEPEGIMIFDDYAWQAYPDPALVPKLAVDAFLAMFAAHLQVLHKGYQVIVQRTPPAQADLPPDGWWRRLRRRLGGGDPDRPR
ncbi:MAG TPA: class I SAM-dependent methyltransferase [Holophaga sp.]|nr:class I SAM-dependent methyltransferase [Holophaga sp.]HPS67319.1 class I SAM-dependent methyltransferase [Holophaga sp.]